MQLKMLFRYLLPLKLESDDFLYSVFSETLVNRYAADEGMRN